MTGAETGPRLRGQTEFRTPEDIDAALRQLERICDERAKDFGKAQALVRRFQQGVPALEAIVFVTRLMMGTNGTGGPMSIEDAVTHLEAEFERVTKERADLRRRVDELGVTERKLTNAIRALTRVQNREDTRGSFKCRFCDDVRATEQGRRQHELMKHQGGNERRAAKMAQQSA